MGCQSRPTRETQALAASSPSASVYKPQASRASVAQTLNSTGIQSPLARWFAEPISFELVGSGEDQCLWQAVESQESSCDVEVSESVACDVDGDLSVGVGPLTTTDLLERPSTASTTVSSSADADCDTSSFADCDVSSTQLCQPKLSASAARRRRRQKAALYATTAIEAATSAVEGGAMSGAGQLAHAAVQVNAGGVALSRFGQRRCAELSAQLSRGGDSLAGAVREMRGSVWRLSLDGHGCRLVQDALRLDDHHSAASLAAELQGHVREAIASPHGNYVGPSQKVLPVPLAEFVVDELRGNAAETARHRYGCRVLCRLIEHASSGETTALLIDEVLAHARDLCAHVYGHYVIECVLEHGNPMQRSAVVHTLRSDMQRYTCDRNSTYVFKAALTHCARDDAEALVEALLGDTDEMLRLAEDQYGHHIVRALLRFPSESLTLRAILQRWESRLRENMYGCRVLEEMTHVA